MARSCFPTCWPAPTTSRCTMEGFKTYEQKGLKLGATERLALRPITLDVGAAQRAGHGAGGGGAGADHQRARGRAWSTGEKMDDIALKGRDFAGYLKLLPGVIDTSNREAPGWDSMGGLSINGRSGGSTSPTTASPTRTPGRTAATTPRRRSTRSPKSASRPRTSRPSTAAAPARRSPSSPAAARRTSTAASAYYKRDDALNGNEFSRRQQCDSGKTAQCDPPLYQFDNTAWTLGGPVLVPGTDFNKGRNKLFFFFSQDILVAHRPGQPESAPDADRARAPGRFLADVRQPGPAGLHPRSAAVAATAAATDRRAGLLPGQRDSGEPDRSGRRRRC